MKTTTRTIAARDFARVQAKLIDAGVRYAYEIHGEQVTLILLAE